MFSVIMFCSNVRLTVARKRAEIHRRDLTSRQVYTLDERRAARMRPMGNKKKTRDRWRVKRWRGKVGKRGKTGLGERNTRGERDELDCAGEDWGGGAGEST